MNPSDQALKYAAAASNMAGAALDKGELSYLASLLDIAVDSRLKGKLTPKDFALDLIKLGLATPDLIQSPNGREKALQCAAEVTELALVLGSFATTSAGAAATAGVATPVALVHAAGLVSQTFSTTVSCTGAIATISGTALKEIEKRFRKVSAATKGLVNQCVTELNKSTEKHFKPENYRFTALPGLAQTLLKDFVDQVRVCLFFSRCELYLLITQKVSADTAKKIAQAIIIVNKYEYKKVPANAVSQLNATEVTRLASNYTNKSVGAVFNSLIERLRV